MCGAGSASTLTLSADEQVAAYKSIILCDTVLGDVRTGDQKKKKLLH